jgi:hypothetical protein
MSEKEKLSSIHSYFENLVNFMIKITESYRYEGKLDDALVFRRGSQMIKNNKNEDAIKYYELVLESATIGGDVEGAKEIKTELNNLSSKN